MDYVRVYLSWIIAGKWYLKVAFLLFYALMLMSYHNDGYPGTIYGSKILGAEIRFVVLSSKLSLSKVLEHSEIVKVL
jgi:hypothetical protein